MTAYDAIQGEHAGMQGDLEYLRVLHLAASTSEADVEVALELLLAERRSVTLETVKALVSNAPPAEVPDLAPQAVDLAVYDCLLEEVVA